MMTDRKDKHVFELDFPEDREESKLLELVAARVKETFEETRRIRIRLDKTLASLQVSIIESELK